MVSDFSFFYFYDSFFRYVPALFCRFSHDTICNGEHSGRNQDFFSLFYSKNKIRACINRSKYFSILLDKIQLINDS